MGPAGAAVEAEPDSPAASRPRQALGIPPVVWTDAHLRPEELEQLRRLGDPAMDELIERLAPRASDDVLALIRSAASAPAGADPTDGRADSFLRAVEAEPEWLDRAALARGQLVFCRYLPLALITLYNYSLVGGFAAPRIARVLEATGYLLGSPAAVMTRLFDTTLFVLDCCGPAGAMAPGAAGWCAALRVRAVHARVRRRLRAAHPGAACRAARGSAPSTIGGKRSRYMVYAMAVPMKEPTVTSSQWCQ